jgi:hypothetical protein
MQLGKWTTQSGAANMSNLLFFKFGSVVGFTNVVAADYTPWPGASAVKFNPVTGSPAYAAYGNIPYWNGTNTTDGYISSTSYHTKDNVLAGRGDPCKLVGLTVAQVKAGTIDNGSYRLPTDAENVAFASSATRVSGNGWATGTTPTAGIHTGNIGTSFLPAAGERSVGGTTIEVGLHGHYWSSRAASSTADNITRGYFIQFSQDYVHTSEILNASLGNTVRCVPQS